MTTSNKTHSLRLDVIAFAVIALSFAIRYWFVATSQLNLVQDEAQYWDWIRRPQLSYYSKGPLIAWVISLWCEVFGNTELGVRFGSVIGMTGIQTAVYIGISRIWREYKLAVFSLFVVVTMPLFSGLGIMMTTDNPLILCWTIGFFALSAATRNQLDKAPSNVPFIILGCTLALGILAKYMMLAFWGLAFVYALILQFRGQLPPRFWKRFLLTSIVGTIVGMLPIVLWNIQNDWVGFKHVAKLSTGDPKPFTLRIGPFFEMLGAQIGVLGPWWFPFIMVGGWQAVKKSITGPIGAFDAKYQHILQSALFFWPLWLAITCWSLKSHTEANWTAAAFVAAGILGGAAAMCWWENPLRTARGKLLLGGSAALITALIFASPILPIPDQYNITNRLKGWESLGHEVERVMTAEGGSLESVFIFSDHYDITSELAFYTPGQPLAYCTWLGDRRMNQYDIWPGPDVDKVGWDAVFVRERHHSGTPKAIQAMFETVGPPLLFETTAGGKTFRKFTLQYCKGYTGYWPKNNSGRY